MQEAPVQPQPQPTQPQQPQPSAASACSSSSGNRDDPLLKDSNGEALEDEAMLAPAGSLALRPGPPAQPQPPQPQPQQQLQKVSVDACSVRGNEMIVQQSLPASGSCTRPPEPSGSEPPARRRRLRGKQAAPATVPAPCRRASRQLVPCSTRTPPEPCIVCTGVPPSEGSREHSGEGRTVAIRPDPRGVGSGRHVSVRNAWVPAAAMGTNGGRPEPPLLGPCAPRLPAPGPAGSRASPAGLPTRSRHRRLFDRAGAGKNASSQPDSERDHG